MGRWQALLKDRNLLIRLVSALVLIPLVLVDVYLGGWWFTGLIALVVLLSMREWARMITGDASGWWFYSLIALVFLVALGFGPNPNPVWSLLWVLKASVAGLVIAVMAKKPHLLALGVPYVLLPALAMLWLRGHEDGLRLIVFLFFVIWATDTGAYLVGRIMGGPKLAPLISPKKTWSGAVGGVVIAGMTGLVVALIYRTELPMVAFGIAMAISVIGQGGDLLESGIKRHYAVKDSGGSIPGHGGILDRIDGLITASIGLALFHAVLMGLGYDWW
ncbi:MAG: phosphatidate cytidylyltransferase [Pseudomonadota bacterium]